MASATVSIACQQSGKVEGFLESDPSVKNQKERQLTSQRVFPNQQTTENQANFKSSENACRNRAQKKRLKTCFKPLFQANRKPNLENTKPFKAFRRHIESRVHGIFNALLCDACRSKDLQLGRLYIFHWIPIVVVGIN